MNSRRNPGQPRSNLTFVREGGNRPHFSDGNRSRGVGEGKPFLEFLICLEPVAGESLALLGKVI